MNPQRRLDLKSLVKVRVCEPATSDFDFKSKKKLTCRTVSTVVGEALERLTAEFLQVH